MFEKLFIRKPLKTFKMLIVIIMYAKIMLSLKLFLKSATGAEVEC